MADCKKCSTRNVEDARFCVSCGAAMVQQPQPAQPFVPQGVRPAASAPRASVPPPTQIATASCPSCRSKHEIGAQFCPSCGHSYTKGRPEEGVQSSAAPRVESHHHKEAAKLANQIVVSFLLLIFCEFKGSDQVSLEMSMIAILIVMGLVYFCLVAKAVNGRNAHWALGIGLAYGALITFGLINDFNAGSWADNNVFDWISNVLCIAQVFLIFKVYFNLKSH